MTFYFTHPPRMHLHLSMISDDKSDMDQDIASNLLIL